MNPYEVLGIAKTASKAAIKKAYRNLAKLFHPDKPGGDAEKFNDITKAYDILADDVKRARYDQNGETEEPEDTITPRAINMMVSVFGAVMNEKDILWRDPLPFMRSALQDMKMDAIKAVGIARQKADHLIKVRARFKMKKEATTHDVISGFIQQNIDMLENTMSTMNEQTIVADKAVEMLDAYIYTPDKNASGAAGSDKVSDIIAEAMKSGMFDIKKRGTTG